MKAAVLFLKRKDGAGWKFQCTLTPLLPRFKKKIPSNAKDNVELRRLPNGGVAVQATSPGKVSGSRAVYEKQIDINGQTIQYTKTTYGPQGNVIHVKDKLSGGIYP